MSTDTDRIRALNDQLRRDLAGGKAVMTPGVAALGSFHPGPAQSCPDSFGDSLPLLLRDRTQNCNHGIFENSAGVEVRLCEGSKADTVAAELVQILECRQCARAGEPVERPEQHDIEAPAAGRCHHRLKLSPVCFGAGVVVFELLHNLPTLRPAEVTELGQLVCRVLTFVAG